jgi:ectoine hydroxylase-related dioxygenase (phytanoyl-CoA dioxygenase family)
MCRGVLGGAVLQRAEVAARAEIHRLRTERPDLASRPALDYLTTIDLCRRDEALRAVVRAPELARRASAALGVPSVRLLYDQLFAKPPGAVLTMWHQDQVYLPIDTSDVVEPGEVGMVRGWVSLTDLPAPVGGLHFVDGSHRFGALDLTEVAIGPPGAGTGATVHGRDHAITDYGAFAAGDATLHAGYTVHGSGPNPSGGTRYGVAVAYVPDGTRVAEPVDDQQQQSIELHAPGRRPGQLIDTDANPVLWPAAA